PTYVGCGARRPPWCTLGTGNSPPNGGDRVGEAIACSELLDEAEEPEMGSGGGGLCADTWPAPPRGVTPHVSLNLQRAWRRGKDAEGPSGSGARGEALDSSGKSHTRVPSRKGSDSESDSSSVSGVSVILKRQTRSTFKRPRMEEGLGLSSSSNALEGPAPPKIPTAVRGGGRGKAKRRAATARSKPAECPAAADSTLKSAAQSDSSVMEVLDVEGSKGARLSETLRQAVREGLRLVAGKKTQSARAAQLKLVEAEIMAAAFDVCRIPSAGKVHQELAEMRRELARLSVSNAALEAELRSTKAELAACRRSQLQPPAQPQAEPDVLGLLRREMTAFQQRYDVLESRLLRPPLAASSTYAAVAARPSSSSGQTGRDAQPPARTRAALPARAPAPPPTQGPAVQTTDASAGRKKRRRGAAAQQIAPATGVPTPTARGSEARRVAKEARKRRKKEQRQRRQQQRREKRAAALLLAPKTAAVVITLQPDAVQRGVTYGDVLAKLKGAVTPAEFGAPDGFAMKVTATGARLLEVPGATSGPTADALAERIRACLGADEARVSRPTKCLDLRILGLDDSVTEHEVVAAVARTGGCPVDQVKTGTI
ncbi:hypothetical protein SFRURICE_000424, partial [Spodoptera frugiperda]